jgi:hypothetical protein
MRFTEEELKQNLEEMYSYYLKLAQEAERKPEDAELFVEEAKAFGAVDAIGAIYLFCFGGKAMMELWLKNCEEPEE